MRFDSIENRRPSAFWPTLAAVALGALLTAAPPGAAAAISHALQNLAGPVLARLPAPPAPSGDVPSDDAPVAALAREVARLRTELADGADREPDHRLVRPTWLTATTLGAAPRRGAVAELLIAAVGRDAAAADAAALGGDLPALDAGADRQIGVGDFVVRDGAIVGRIAAAGRWTATVRPLTDPDFRLAVTVPQAADEANAGGGATAVLAGSGEPLCFLLHLPAARPVTVGTVVTCEAAETGGAPLPVGVVAAVDAPEADGRRAIRVRPLATLDAAAGGGVEVVRAGLNRRRVGAGEDRP